MKNVVYTTIKHLLIYYTLLTGASCIADENIAASSKNNEASFLSFLDIYCMNFTQLGGVGNFNKILLNPMKISASGDNQVMQRYWSTAYCEPRLIGGTKSPIIHLIAENPTDRNSYLLALKKYYVDTGDEHSFTEILNSKNSRGYTLLDYVLHLYRTDNYIEDEEKPLNQLIEFLCDNNASFSFYEKKCPLEYFSLSKK